MRAGGGLLCHAPHRWQVFQLALMVCAFSMGLSLLNLFAPGFAYRAHVTLAVAML
eukprot:COSAG01_NODE_41072_length_456_cov_0.722689_2_plen_54_part_01